MKIDTRLKCIPIAMLGVIAGGVRCTTTVEPIGGGPSSSGSSSSSGGPSSGGSSSGNSPTDGEDAGAVPVNVGPDADGGPYCTTPLTDAGPSIVDDSAVAALCAANQGRVKQWATPCGPYLALSVAIGVDCDRQYVFDAASRQLVAVVAGCNGVEHCVQGNSSFVPPVDPDGGFFDYQCLYAHVFVDICPDAGIADASTD